MYKGLEERRPAKSAFNNKYIFASNKQCYEGVNGELNAMYADLINVYRAESHGRTYFPA